MPAPPKVTTLGTWEADNVTVGQVEGALSELRRHEQRAAVRTSVLTLVAVVADEVSGRNALEVVSELGTRHPSRTVVIILDDHSDESGLDAEASVHAIEHGSRAVCFEELLLRVRGRTRHHLDSLVEPFAVPDLPLVVWLPARLPSPGDPLLAVSDRIVIDSRAVAGMGSTADSPSVLPRIAALARRLPVTDLSWTRLAPWRTLLAGLFEGPVYRPFLREIEKVEVAGNYGPRHMLGGWLLKRLSLPTFRIELRSAEHASIRIKAVHRDRTGVFTVARPGAARVIHASAEVERGPSVSQVLHMGGQWPSQALAGALTRMGRDDVFCEALDGALALKEAAA